MQPEGLLLPKEALQLSSDRAKRGRLRSEASNIEERSDEITPERGNRAKNLCSEGEEWAFRTNTLKKGCFPKENLRFPRRMRGNTLWRGRSPRKERNSSEARMKRLWTSVASEYPEGITLRAKREHLFWRNFFKSFHFKGEISRRPKGGGCFCLFFLKRGTFSSSITFLGAKLR